MSFDPEFMRLVETMGAEDAARKAEATANAAEEQRIKALHVAEYEEYRARRRAQEQELLRRGRVTFAMARTITTLAAERRVPEDIEIGYLVKVEGARWRRRQPPERVVQASGWRIEQNRVEPTKVAVEEKVSSFMVWLQELGDPEPPQESTDVTRKREAELERKREYRTIPGYEYGVLLARTGELYHYRWQDDPQYGDGPAIVTTSKPSTPVADPRRNERYGEWDYPREQYDLAGRESCAYPTQRYDRALARFAIDHALLPQA